MPLAFLGRRSEAGERRVIGRIGLVIVVFSVALFFVGCTGEQTQSGKQQESGKQEPSSEAASEPTTEPTEEAASFSEEAGQANETGQEAHRQPLEDRSPEEVLALQYEYINSGDFENAYSLFAEQSQRDVSLEQYGAFFKANAPYSVTDYSFSAPQVQGDSATVDVTFTSNSAAGAEQLQRTQQFVRENGEWRVVMRADQVAAFKEQQAAEAQYADGGGAPAEQFEEALDQLPEASAAKTDAAPVTTNTLESLEEFLEDIALQEVNPFWAQTFAGLQQAQQNEQTQQYGDQYTTTSEVDYYYESADLMLIEQPTESACGVIGSDTGSAYCPPERTVYFVLSSELEDAEKYGDFSFAFTIAHEWGHHVQNELGYSNLRDERNDVAFENQADCFAGVWASSYYTRGNLNNIDILEGINATYGFGDTRLEEEGKAHGSPAERVQWFLTGYNTSDPSACRTFTP